MTARALPGAWLVVCLSLWAGCWLDGFHREWIAAFWTPAGWSGPMVLDALRGHLRSAAGAALVLLGAAGAARPLLRWIGIPPQSMAVRSAAGCAVFMPIAGLGFGWPGLLRPVLLIPILLAGALCEAGRFRIRHSESEILPYRLFLFGVFFFLLLPSLLLALAPETHYDALEYHLAFPERFRLHGKVFDPGFPPLSRFHLGGEMLFALAGIAGRDGAIKLVNWMLLPVVVLLVLRAARSAGAPATGVLAAGIALAASPLLAVVGGHALTDLPALAAVAAVTGLRLAGRGPVTALAIGLLLGGAGTVKTTLMPLGLVALPFLARRGERLPMLAGFVLPLAPWIARTWLESGSPGGGLFLPGWWPPFDHESGVRPFLDHVEWGGSPWSRALALPSVLISGSVRTGHEMSPLLAAALPALLLPARLLAPRTAPLARASLAMTAGWAIGGGGQVRWLLPALVLLLPAATGVRIPKRPLVAVTAIAAILGWARTCVFLFVTATPLDVALGLIPARAYLAARITPPPLYMQLAATLRNDPSLGRAYVAGDLKAYYWPRDPVLDAQHVTPRLVRWARDTGDEVRLRVKLRQARVGCIVHRNEGSLTLQELAGGYRWSGQGLNALERLVARSDRVLALERPESNAYYYVYALRPPKRPVRVADLRWLALPGAELLFLEGDKLLGAGNPKAAEPVYRAIAARFPESALPWLRLAECARLRKDPVSMRRFDRLAADRLGLSGR